MFNAISTQFKLQSPQLSNSRTRQSFGSKAVNYQIKDVVSFGNSKVEDIVNNPNVVYEDEFSNRETRSVAEQLREIENDPTREFQFQDYYAPAATSNKEDAEALKTTKEKEEESSKKGDYDPNRTALEGVPSIKKTVNNSDIHIEKVINAMEKAGISANFDTTLEKILDSNRDKYIYKPMIDRKSEILNASRAAYFKPKATCIEPLTLNTAPNPSVSILKEIEDKGGNIAEMNEEIQNNIKPYLLKDYYNEKEDRLELDSLAAKPASHRFSGYSKSVALAQMIRESKTAKENPDPWVVILDKMINEPDVHKDDAFVIEQAAEALCEIGNNADHLKVFTKFKETKDNINSTSRLLGIASAGENIIKARAESADSN